MELRAIPGVGEKTASALEALDDPEAALAAGDVAAIATAPGITRGRAAQLARNAIRARHGETGQFLATDRAADIYETLLDRLRDRAETPHARARLGTLYPSCVPDRIDEIRSRSRDALAMDPDPAVIEALDGVAPLEAPGGVRVDDRCVATGDAETYATARDAVPELSVELVESRRKLADLARGYATVIALDEQFAGVEVDGDVRVDPDALADPLDLVPERALAFFAANRDRIRAAIRALDAADRDVDDLDGVTAALERLDGDGSVAGDDELDRLDAALSGLSAAVDTAETAATSRLRDAIREREVTIEGADLLSLVDQGAGADSILSRELRHEFEAAVEAARGDLVDALDLDDHEARAADHAFPSDPTFPVTLDEDAIADLRDDLRAARDRRAAAEKRELARALHEHRPAVEAAVSDALDLDLTLAIARFADDYDCTLPEIGGTGLSITAGRSPLLDEPVADIEPVDYAADGIVLLSGVNSGGKTATLDLVAAVTVLAHMGLPVPADAARVERVDEVFYYAPAQGTLDAGAFESAIRAFGDLDPDRSRLVLVDELESITEPGAAAKIIAGILEYLDATGATAVFVSHLAAEIRDELDVDVRVDGIEALGLENGELRVNRSPVRDHIARSTPELIVRSLAADDDGFYAGLLERFET